MLSAISFSYSDKLNIDTAFEIRRKVFVIEQEVEEREEYDEFEPTSIHYLVFVNDIPVGTARWRIAENGIKLDRFAVLKEYRNARAGRTVLLKYLKMSSRLKKRS